jgi:hypothetical protein
MRFPFERNRSNDRKSLKIKTLEQAHIEKSINFFKSLPSKGRPIARDGF